MPNTNSELSEGSNCPFDDCSGTIGFQPVEDCYCHVAPPCEACVNNPLTCSVCGYTGGDDERMPIMTK